MRQGKADLFRLGVWPTRECTFQTIPPLHTHTRMFCLVFILLLPSARELHVAVNYTTEPPHDPLSAAAPPPPPDFYSTTTTTTSTTTTTIILKTGTEASLMRLMSLPVALFWIRISEPKVWSAAQCSASVPGIFSPGTSAGVDSHAVKWVWFQREAKHPNGSNSVCLQVTHCHFPRNQEGAGVVCLPRGLQQGDWYLDCFPPDLPI